MAYDNSSLLMMWTISICALCLVAVEAKDCVTSVLWIPFSFEFSQKMFGAHLFTLLPAASIYVFNRQELETTFATALTATSVMFKKFFSKLTTVFFSALFGLLSSCIIAHIFSPRYSLFFSQTLIQSGGALTLIGAILIRSAKFIGSVFVFLGVSSLFVSDGLTSYANCREKMRTFSTHVSELRNRFFNMTIRAFPHTIFRLGRSWHNIVLSNTYTYAQYYIMRGDYGLR